MRRFVVIDLETTGQLPSKGDRIIEIGIVVIENKKIIKKYAQLINPKRNIPVFISQLTGIEMEDTINAPAFEEVAEDILKLIDNSYIVAHNIPFDIGFLNAELNRLGYDSLKNKMIDTVELARIALPKANSYKLNELAHFLNLRHDDPHRALSDAWITADLLLFILRKIERLPTEIIKKFLQIEKYFKSDIFDILEDISEIQKDINTNILMEHQDLIIRKFNPSKLSSSFIKNDNFQDLADNFFDIEGMLHTTINNYELRKDQKEMAETIYDHFRSKNHAIIEADTGIGKSFAYLLPAIYESVQLNEPIIISTHTTHLQTQLLDNELETLHHLLPSAFSAVLVKGKNHYISLAKVEKFIKDQTIVNYHDNLFKGILLIWLTETDTGDLDEIQIPRKDFKLLQKVVTKHTTHNELWRDIDFYERKKESAKKANIIITNHALLCKSLKNKESILPQFHKVIIDEAHQFQQVAAKHFGLELDYTALITELQQIKSDFLKIISSQFFKNWELKWELLLEEFDILFRNLYRFVAEDSNAKKNKSDIGRIQKIWVEQDLNNETVLIKEIVNRIMFELLDMLAIKTTAEQLKDQAKEEKRDSKQAILFQQIEALKNNFQQMLLKGDSNSITWVEIDPHGAQNAAYLYSEPIDVSKHLYKELFNTDKTAVLTSATLSIRNNFDYLKQHLGLAKETDTYQFYASFDYEKQVQLMVPNDFPTIKYSDMQPYTYAVAEAIESLALISGGRMLVLFTSYEMLKQCYYILREIESLEQYIVIGQGISSGSRDRLRKNFQSFDKAILLGTNSFWEGVDIPGDDLRCIVIAKLPFQAFNHPLYDAKATYLKSRGENPFTSLSLPDAVLRFRQGFGRLIRKQTDKGIIFVCDDRIMNKSYGKDFLRSIPKVKVLHASLRKLIDEADEWL
ncbi:ATP-dependent DNA helicase DinG [Saliterribacillus persicus]|uniref:3'-5' exonuclease DinG n=1 Tax=Saliterribacillus persicus TaxID=930114 RepID=A0A368XD47_9BACI|nr:ATP-dependent DNA helicase DinG [Saliterribacillus persicus]RCW64938.1 ATP-dependent DNA helicase DinG [Saliterribacillus persicus]